MPNPHKPKDQQKPHNSKTRLKPKHSLIALPQTPMLRLSLHNIRKPQHNSNPQMHRAVDQRTSQTLSRLRHTGRDENVGQIETDVDSDRAADHGGEYVGPVVPAWGDYGEEDRGPDVAEAGYEH